MRPDAPLPPAPEDALGATLNIDLRAVVANWQALDKRTGRNCNTGAVVKADAYGLGMTEVASALARAGCKTFYVADAGEGIVLRKLLGPATLEQGPRIIVFSGPLAGTEKLYLDHQLIPVLNSLEQVDRWRTFVGAGSVLHETVLHVDTGMNRLGLASTDFDTLMSDADRTVGLFPLFLMSHLISSEIPGAEITRSQRERFANHFARFTHRFPDAGGSLANSAGIFNGPDFHLQYVRPGAALYGVNPTPGKPAPVIPAVRLMARIFQVRTISEDGTVGYGQTAPVRAGMRLATVGLGYADGYPRSLSNAAQGVLAGHKVPLLGRVSMDLAVFDVSHVPASDVREGEMIELLGPALTVDELGATAGSFGYEILTSLGRRYHRRYLRA